MVSYMHAPSKNGKENSFVKGKRKLRGLQLTKSLWLSLAEFLPGRKRSVFFLLGSAIFTGHESALFWSPYSIQLRFLFINFFSFKSLCE